MHGKEDHSSVKQEEKSPVGRAQEQQERADLKEEEDGEQTLEKEKKDKEQMVVNK